MIARILLVALFFGFAATASAFDGSDGTVQQEVLSNLDTVSERLISLAEAVPEDQYAWRPSEGVRSFSEVFTHMASSSYFMADRLGTPTPDDVNPQEMEASVTDKAQVVEELERALEHLREAVRNVSDDELEEMASWFGGSEITRRAVMINSTRHAGEHLGQLIAYSRVNGIVPPWSQ